MPNITTKDEFKDYILKRLGFPVIQVEIDSSLNGQMDDIIDDTVQDFCRYNFDEGSYLHYTTLIVSAGISEYSLSGYNIEAAYDLDLSFGYDGINVLFSPTHVLLYDQWVNKGNYPGGPGYSYAENNGMYITEWEIAMEYLEQIKMSFGKHYRAKWHKGREVLEIIPTPQQCMGGMIALYIREKAEYLYNHPLVKKLAIARCMILWGIHLTKYNVTLPDGITINGQDMVSKGERDEEKWFDRLFSESQPPDFFIG